MAVPPSEIARYRSQVGGMSIKIMTLALIGSTAWFSYNLYARGRMPWQHGNGAEILSKRGL